MLLIASGAVLLAGIGTVWQAQPHERSALRRAFSQNPVASAPGAGVPESLAAPAVPKVYRAPGRSRPLRSRAGRRSFSTPERCPSPTSPTSPGSAQPDPGAAGDSGAPAPQAVGPANRWAVLIGIQYYAGSTHPTFGGRGDVDVIRAALLRSGWRADHILMLLDCQASGKNITEAMAWLADRSGPATFSFFHFSGHACIARRGPCAAGHTYLWSQDNAFIPESTVGTLLGRVQGQAWLDFAGCEAGAFDAGLSSADRLVTGASQASETAYEVPGWNESVWSGLVWDQAFLHGRAGAAPGRATIHQMVAYGTAQAPQITAAQAAGPQHPYVAGGDPSQTLYAPHP